MSLKNLILDPYQKRTIKLMFKKKGLGLFLDQGTGKTIISLGFLDQFKDQYPNFKCLIICTKTGLDATWNNSINLYTPHIRENITLIHFEGITPYLRNKFRKQKFDITIVDEGQRAKNRNSKTSRILKSLNNAEYKFLLSGTPQDGNKDELNPIEYWGLFRFFAPQVFGESWRLFHDEYLRPAGFMGKKPVFKRSKIKQFKKKAEKHIIRISRGILDLPKMRIKKIKVIPTSTEKLFYDNFLRDELIKIKDKTIISQLAITMAIKLHQISCGFIKDEEGEIIKFQSWSGKQRRLLRLLRKNNKPPALYFYRFTQNGLDIADCLDRLDIEYIFIDKKTKDIKKAIEEARSKNISILTQIKKGGVGLDLEYLNLVIMYSFTYSSIDVNQALSRVHRRGQLKEVNVWVLLTKGFIDEYIWGVVVGKLQINNALLKYFERKNNNG